MTNDPKFNVRSIWLVMLPFVDVNWLYMGFGVFGGLYMSTKVLDFWYDLGDNGHGRRNVLLCCLM